MRKAILSICAALLALPLIGHAGDPVEDSFYPYKNGAPTYPGLAPGLVINKANLDQFKEIVDAGTYDMIKQGLLPEIKVTETFDFTPHPKYIEASRTNVGKVKIVNGDLEGYLAGRPFPEEPSTSDKDAGRKLAFNFRHTFSAGDNVVVDPFYWKYRDMKSGKIERILEMQPHFLNFKHRVSQAPIPEVTPNPNGLFRALYLPISAPQDVADTQLLVLVSEKDSVRPDGYLYLGFQRRTRRLETGQVTDPFLGSDLMIQDFEGYFGRVGDMNWEFKGAKNLLLPMYKHNEQKLTDEFKMKDGYKFIGFKGQGECFLDVTWQLRKVYEVKLTPVDKSNPVGYRTILFDAQTFVTPRIMIYDRAGKLWKWWTLGYAHPDYYLPINKGTGASLYDSFSMVDVQNQHCTTGQFRTEVDPARSPVKMFSPQYLRGH